MAIGVYKHETGMKSNHYKHGKTGTRIYRIYANMKTRCYNMNYPKYNDYGGRGITVCEEWKNSFNSFYTWAISNGYTDKLTIDRIDNNGNYTPSNCRWVDYHIQGINKRNTKKYKYEKITFCSCEVKKLFGVNRTTFEERLKRGWTMNEAIRGVKNAR